MLVVMPPISGFCQPNILPSEFCAQGLNGVVRYCTTLRRNTHGTGDERELLYPWHPWAGQPVHIHEVIEKAGVTVFRCSLSGQASDRLLEVPAWMFDRTACTNWHVTAAPHVNFTALRALAELLRDMGTHSQEMCAALVSHDTNRGEVSTAEQNQATGRRKSRPLAAHA